jgi:hypothetical protein
MWENTKSLGLLKLDIRKQKREACALLIWKYKGERLELELYLSILEMRNTKL